MKKNYFRFKKWDAGYLLTNELGHYAFLSKDAFMAFLSGDGDKLKALSVYEKLKDLMFFYDVDDLTFIEEAGIRYRQYKQYLFQGPQLHIFVLTRQCNQQCVYCQASANVNKAEQMSVETARKAVDIALQSPSKYLTFEFQGGEPLLNFETLKYIVEYTELHKKDKEVEFTVVSNLLVLDETKLDFLQDHNVGISTSIDGDETLHNKNRPAANTNVFRAVSDKISLIQNRGLNISAIETTTRFTFSAHRALIDQYVKFGLNQIFIRPLTPLGIAGDNWDLIGYTAEEFVEFYQKCFAYLIEVNQSGYLLAEGHATMFLKKILGNSSGNYMELRSPCGGAIGQVAYYYNGKIFSCDEARMLSEMGDNSFQIGNVETDNLGSIISSPICKLISEASCLEGLTSCNECVFNPYCGTCPIISYAKYGTLYPGRMKEYRCEIYKGMITTIFSYILKNDPEINSIFESWIY